MASRVNLKFVILLTTFFVIASGAVVGAAYMVLSKSGENYEAMGDEAYSAGEFQLAAEMYGRAVGHDRTRVDWLEKWRDALTQTTPETTAEYLKAYNEQYIGILTQLATLQPNNTEAQSDLLQALFDRVWWLARTPEAWEAVMNRATRAIDRIGEDDPNAIPMRRYRGLAGLEQMRQFDLAETERDRTLADLRAAIEANPEDAEVASAIASWHMMEWRAFRRSRQVEQAEEYESVVDSQIESLRERFPDSALAQTMALELEVERGLIASSTYAARRAAMRGLQGSEAALIDIFDNAPTDALDGPLVSRYVRLLRGLRPDDRHEPVIRVCERVLAERPDDAQMRLVLVGALQDSREHERAIEEAEIVASAPDLPLSLQGLLLRELRIRAVATQAENSLGLWEAASDPADRAEQRSRLTAYRERLVSMSPGQADSPRVLLLDARVALADGRDQAALAALEQYRRSTGADEDAEVLRLTTRALLGDNQLGAARDKVEQLLALEPDNTQALLLAAEIDRRLLEPDRAVDRLRMLVELEPDNEAFRQALGAALASTGVRPADSPVLSELVAVRQLLADDPTQVAEGVRRLEALIDANPNDIRPHLALIEILDRQQDDAAAIAATERALAQFPDSDRFAAIMRRLTASDPVELALAQFDEADLPEVERILGKRAVLVEAGRTDEAEALYQEALALDPDDRLILEIQIAEAVSAGDFATAEQVAQRAADTNADDVNGALFQALLEQGRGEHEAAVETLQRVLERLPYSGRAWQMLGQSQLNLGQVTDAVESLQRSFDARPDDLRAAQALAGALLQLQRTDDALEVARRSAELNPGSRRAWILLLELEEAAGDRDFVIRERRRLLDLNPDDIENRIGLIRTLTATGNYADAADLLADTRDEFGDSLALALREALLLAAQNQVEAGRQRLLAFIESEETPSVESYISLADFLLTADRPADAVEALRAARPFQSPDLLEIDRMLGDTLYGLGRLEEAVEPYQTIAASSGPDTDAVAKRLAETYLRLGRFDDATATLDGIGAAPDDAEILLIRAEIALGQGDERAGQELLNQAVAVAPSNPLPFVRRARANLANEERDNEVLDDLEQALRLQPNLVTARQLRAFVLERRERYAEAATELALAVEASPRDDALRLDLIRFNLRYGFWSRAITAAEGGVEVSSRAPNWLRAAADVYVAVASAEQNAREANQSLNNAASLLREAFAASNDQQTAVRLLDIVMQLNPPAAQEALELLAQLPADMTSRPEFLMLASRAKAALGRTPEALEDAGSAFAQLTTQDGMRLWFLAIGAILNTPLEAAQFARQQTPPPALEPAYTVQLTLFEAADISRRSELIERLREVESRAQETATLVTLYRLRSRLEYQDGDYEAAVATLRSGRALAPDDSEFNNNLAFVLAKHIGDLDAALEPALKAAELRPNDPNVLDTLGWIYLRTGQLAQAQAHLQQAVELATTPIVSVPANIHLAEVYLINEEFPAARRHIERARTAIRFTPELAEEYQPELDSLIQRLDQAEG